MLDWARAVAEDRRGRRWVYAGSWDGMSEEMEVPGTQGESSDGGGGGGKKGRDRRGAEKGREA